MDIISASDIIIPVMGITGSGKSTFIARCTGDTSGIGHTLQSHTKDVDIIRLDYKGHTIRLVDTPGFDDSRSDLDDSHILKEIASWLVIAYSQTPPLLLSGIIYLHPINEAGGRMRGSARNNLKMFQAMCGNEPLSSVVLATTMWGKIDEAKGQKTQEQLSEQYWNTMIDAGSKVIRHDDTKESALRIIDHIISRKTQVGLKMQKQLVEGDLTVEDTDAGQELKSKVTQERAKTDEKLRDVKEDLEQALAESDNASANELLDEQRKFESLIKAKDAELKSMKIKAEQLHKEKLEALAAAERDREKRRMEHDARIAALKKDLESVRGKQMELQRQPAPPDYASATLAQQNQVLMMELRKHEQQREIERFQGEQKMMAIELKRYEEQREYERYQGAQTVQAQYHQEATELQRESLKHAKRGVNWAAVGGVAGTAAVLACNVM